MFGEFTSPIRVVFKDPADPITPKFLVRLHDVMCENGVTKYYDFDPVKTWEGVTNPVLSVEGPNGETVTEVQFTGFSGTMMEATILGIGVFKTVRLVVQGDGGVKIKSNLFDFITNSAGAQTYLQSLIHENTILDRAPIPEGIIGRFGKAEQIPGSILRPDGKLWYKPGCNSYSWMYVSLLYAFDMYDAIPASGGSYGVHTSPSPQPSWGIYENGDDASFEFSVGYGRDTDGNIILPVQANWGRDAIRETTWTSKASVDSFFGNSIYVSDVFQKLESTPK